MKILNAIVDKFAGGILKEGFDIVKSYFPPSMTDQEKQMAQLAYEKFVFEKQKEANREGLAVDQEFNQRLKDMEGTATDLKSIPVLGNIIIFIRGAQRPIWGVFVMYADYMVFSKAWNLSEEPELRSMLFAVNLLVLGFLFGERAVKNILPFLKEFLGKK